MPRPLLQSTPSLAAKVRVLDQLELQKRSIANRRLRKPSWPTTAATFRRDGARAGPGPGPGSSRDPAVARGDVCPAAYPRSDRCRGDADRSSACVLPAPLRQAGAGPGGAPSAPAGRRLRPPLQADGEPQGQEGGGRGPRTPGIHGVGAGRGAENFASLFEVEQTLTPTKVFTQTSCQLPPETRAALNLAGVRQIVALAAK
jgi:hypothetical protein